MKKQKFMLKIILLLITIAATDNLSASQHYQAYQNPTEQRSIPLITVQNLSGGPLEVGVKFTNGTVTKKLKPIDNEKFLSLDTNLNVEKSAQDLAQPTTTKQEGNFTNLTLTRESQFITYKNAGAPWFGSYSTYQIDISEYLRNENIKTIVIKILSDFTTKMLLTFKDHSTQTVP